MLYPRVWAETPRSETVPHIGPYIVDLHKTNNFAPNEFIGVVNSSDLVVYKGSNARDKKVLIKVKAESK